MVLGVLEQCRIPRRPHGRKARRRAIAAAQTRRTARVPRVRGQRRRADEKEVLELRVGEIRCRQVGGRQQVLSRPIGVGPARISTFDARCHGPNSGGFRRPGLPGCRLRFALRGASRARGAALVRQVTDEAVHGGVVGAVEELPAHPRLPDEPRPLQRLQVERQRRRRKPDALPDRSGRQALGPWRTSSR